MIHPDRTNSVNGNGHGPNGRGPKAIPGHHEANSWSAFWAADGDDSGQRSLAYFSMEIGILTEMPTYSGGLGVLAGDTVRAAADFSVPMAAVSLLHRKGTFRQRLDRDGNQTEEVCEWAPEQFLEPLAERVSVELEGRRVEIRAWRHVVQGEHGYTVPVYFLDTNLPENTPADRTLTDHLYGGDDRYRLCQEVILGIGGASMLEALGHHDLRSYHMNEGHSALLTVWLLEKALQASEATTPGENEIRWVRQHCVFTTHTPVAAGHDRFWMDLFRHVLGSRRCGLLDAAGFLRGGEMTMTDLGLYFARYVNGVSMRHAQVSREMFPTYFVHSVTNGAHGTTWTSEPFARLYDDMIPGWRADNRYLRHAVSLPLDRIQLAHAESKRELMREIERRNGVRLEPAALTVGFARRATAYKRGDLMFTDPERLRRIVAGAGPLQLVFAGKAHPRDESGKDVIRRIHRAAAELGDVVKVVYLENYDMKIAAHLTSGVDLWVNTPQRPMEASGTSGMKAALNGIPCLSVLDGWWIEGHVEGVTGWSVGDASDDPGDRALEVASLYDKLEYLVVPMFYKRPKAWAEVMRSAIALNGSFFNAHRMISQYVENAYPTGGLRRLERGSSLHATVGASIPGGQRSAR